MKKGEGPSCFHTVSYISQPPHEQFSQAGSPLRTVFPFIRFAAVSWYAVNSPLGCGIAPLTTAASPQEEILSPPLRVRPESGKQDAPLVLLNHCCVVLRTVDSHVGGQGGVTVRLTYTVSAHDALELLFHLICLVPQCFHCFHSCAIVSGASAADRLSRPPLCLRKDLGRATMT